MGDHDRIVGREGLALLTVWPVSAARKRASATATVARLARGFGAGSGGLFGWAAAFAAASRFRAATISATVAPSGRK